MARLEDLLARLRDLMIDRVKEAIAAKVGYDNKICLLSTKQLLGTLSRPVLFGKPLILPAFNPRIVTGIVDGILDAAYKLGAVIGFELARSESGYKAKPGYTGMYPELFSQIIFNKLAEREHTLPVFLNGDHITIRDTSEKEFNIAMTIINEEIQAGYTSFAIDASHNELPDNIRITTQLAKHILSHDRRYGLELEVGEILKTYDKDRITTVAEALEFTRAIKNSGIDFQLLAINNGAFHGLPEPGKEINIDYVRTKEIAQAIAEYGVGIAQHGVSGTAPGMLRMLARDRIIAKGNIATIFQVAAIENMDPDIAEAMEKAAKEREIDIKMVISDFREQIENQPKKYTDRMRQVAYQIAYEHIRDFRAEDTADMIAEEVQTVAKIR